MYISSLEIEGFRVFGKTEKIKFKEGMNVIIGHNNSGKTTIIKALSILFGKSSKKLNINDFNKNISIEEIKKNPPKIRIMIKFIESDNEDNYSEDLATIATWLTKIEKPYEAKLTYEYFLSKKEEGNYKRAMKKINSEDIQDYWNEINFSFLRKYVSRILIGEPEYENTIDNETVNKFDFQLLTAIRDVERDMFSGKNVLLKEIIDFFIDYDIKTNSTLSDEEKREELNKKRLDFSSDAQKLIEKLKNRMKTGKENMLKYVENTGASYENLKPDFDGRILDTELYSALNLIVENELGFKIPASQNGLGYNNLIYISLLLAKMQKNASEEYLGVNAKIYSILAIEEPEAHLHPNMQYKFLKFLDLNKEKEVRQIFITTHSPNITAAIDLENIIILNKIKNQIQISYPRKVFSDSQEDIKSLRYVQRFLDVTKSDIFFAKGIILVEGITEQLLVPELAKIMNLDLYDYQVSIINIGGRYFDHFLKLFDTKNENALNKPVACITDLDPIKKKKSEGSNWVKSFPFEINIEKDYEYKSSSNRTLSLYENKVDNIKIFSQKKKESCTFEYDLILSNPTLDLLITDSVTNKDELRNLMDSIHNDESKLEDFLKLIKNDDFRDKYGEIINKTKLDESDKKKHLLAARYLKSISKGSVAQEIAQSIVNLSCTEDFKVKFSIPKYLREAIEWICH